MQLSIKQHFTKLQRNMLFGRIFWNVKTHDRASLHTTRLCDMPELLASHIRRLFVGRRLQLKSLDRLVKAFAFTL